MPERKTVQALGVGLHQAAGTAAWDAAAAIVVGVGPNSLLVAARVDLADNGLEAEAIEHLANEPDERISEAVPEVNEVFLDPTPRESRTRT